MALPSHDDRLAISDLLVRYTTSLDEGDVEAVVGCFTENGVVDSPITEKFEGHERIRFFASRIARYRLEHGAQFRHFISNLVVDAEGDRAIAKCYLLDFLTMNGKTELLSPGVYECRLVKIKGEWFMENRLVRMDYRFTLPWSAPRSGSGEPATQ